MKFNRIVAKLGGAIIILFLVVLLPLGYVTNQIVSGFYYKKIQDEISESSARYAESISTIQDPIAAVRKFEEISQFTNVRMVMADDRGHIIANSGVPWAAQETVIAQEDMNAFTEAKTLLREMNSPSNGDRFLVAAAPIMNGTHFRGAVYVLASTQDVRQSLRNVQELLILSGIGAFFLALGFTFILSRKLSHPLIEMERATRQMATGNLNIRVQVPARDEMGSLATAINELAVDLGRYRDSRSEFFASISHELRTPMAYLEGYTHVLKEGLYESEQEKERYLDIIHKEAVRLTRLIEDLFALSKMEEGKISLDLEWIDLAEVIEHSLKKVELNLKSKGLNLSVGIPASVPLVYADGLRMEQIYMNLLDNAIRYTEAGNIDVQVSTAEPDRVITVIEDSGIGIPAEELPYIFERFYRVEKSRSRERGGTGLGLAIVKKLVNIQGGSIQVSSSLGQGTRFEIVWFTGGSKYP
ncbi:HAMP domain-containing sensor histidine kinase [Paenibacillus filicis]|uniref:histidine kinase n=1 Tax=Paenibacillus filicis TaxID=669464 RepID=A0ABU9DNX5_9BACL